MIIVPALNISVNCRVLVIILGINKDTIKRLNYISKYQRLQIIIDYRKAKFKMTFYS